MVTTTPTRREPVEEELNDDNSINVYVPTRNSRRRKRIEGEENPNLTEEKATTSSPKKRKILPVRVKDGEDDMPSSSRLVVEIPAKRMSPPVETLAAVNGQETTPKTKHRRFDSEQSADEFYSTAREQAVEKNEDSQQAVDEDEDSEDDAPEAIGMQEAAETIKSREKDAARAVKEQLSASRQKRKERDEALRKQSESAKKRKPKTQTPEVLEHEVIEIESDDPEVEDNSLAVDDIGIEEDEIPRTRIASYRALPDLLPMEYLEDDDVAEVVAMEEQPRNVSTKRKFKDLSEKKPKDRRIGATTYRVTKVQSTNLAPKAAHHARSMKELWLQGRSGKKIDPSRKPFSKSFFKN
ncbi:hypothetical protein EG329_011592 [Mollisiaceae sp. DMI_Dod_QoI]|nr:hypothetical protein EG329_011592 [Helotiales sp. DMI_Dod_QoI]